MKIDLGQGIDLPSGGRLLLDNLIEQVDWARADNLRRVDDSGRQIWAAKGGYSGAELIGDHLTAYDTAGFSRHIDFETGEILKSVFTK